MRRRGARFPDRERGGNGLGPNDDPRRDRDVSVMDDFIFGEPQPMK